VHKLVMSKATGPIRRDVDHEKIDVEYWLRSHVWYDVWFPVGQGTYWSMHFEEEDPWATTQGSVP
jgi:hypothetical protein